MIYNLGEKSSLISHFLAELRAVDLQQDRSRFRLNMERLGGIFAYEISKQLPSVSRLVTTPLGTASPTVPAESPVLIAIMRAGLPLHQGLLTYFDRADCGYVGAYRRHSSAEHFDICVEYLSCSRLDGRTVVIADPMLATGRSLVTTITELTNYGTPRELHIVSVISAQPGIDYVTKNFPDAVLWTAGIDPTLNESSYIVPGLGDAGDLAFGRPYAPYHR